MADLEPTWEAIANKWADALRQTLSWVVYYPYPQNAVDRLELPAVIINEPTNVTFAPFTFGALMITYTGGLSLLAHHANNGIDVAFSLPQIHATTAASVRLYTAVHHNRLIKKVATSIALGAGDMGFLNPYDKDARGYYAGSKIPYTVQMQYRSGS